MLWYILTVVVENCVLQLEPSLSHGSVRPELDVQPVAGGVDTAGDLSTVSGYHCRVAVAAFNDWIRTNKPQSAYGI